MSLDIIVNQVFAQERPHHICQNRGFFDKLHRESGIKKKCRDPRCSIECLKNFMRMENYLLQYLWESKLPPGHRTFRGNLTLHKGATIEHHRAARKAFLASLARWTRKSGKTIKVRCYSDCTSHVECHYDFVAYVSDDVGVERVREIVKDAWLAAGGRRSSCTTLHDDDQAAWSTYTTKSRKVDDLRFRYVPETNGLDYTWGSSGFWTMSRAAFKAEWCKVMFPKHMIAEAAHPTTSPRPITISVKVLPNPVAQAALKSAQSLAAGEVERVRYQADLPFAHALESIAAQHPDVIQVREDRPVYTPPDDRASLRNILPRGIAHAAPIGALAERLGWGVDRVQEAMIGQRSIKFTGKNSTVRYYME